MPELVPARPEQFHPRIQGDRLEGRGAYDMKGGLAAMMCAVHDCAANGKVRVRFICVPDEESDDVEHRCTEALVQEGLRADFAITDNSTVESPVTVTGVPGNAPSALSVPVAIKHTYVGDLKVELLAPDGSAYVLKDYGVGGSSDDINTSYTVNASSETANGTWKLRVSDNAAQDIGTLDSWGLQF